MTITEPSEVPVAASGGEADASHAHAPLALSIIIPAYNEEDNVRPLYEAIMATVDQLGPSFEIIFVDDGSSDGTFERLTAVAAHDPRVRVIKLRRNYGQTPAMVAGIDYARGQILVTMDADLQNDPADIEALLAKIDQGHDLVVGWRRNRQDKWLSRKLPSVIANRLIAAVTGVRVKDNGCTLKAFRAELIKGLPLYSEMHRFIPAMMSILGCSLAEIDVRHHARQFGTSKYGLSRIYKVCFDLIAISVLIKFARRPLFCFGGMVVTSVVLSLLCFALGLHAILTTSADATIVYMTISVLFGSLAVFLGLIGGIVAMVVYEAGAPIGSLLPMERSSS